MKLLDNRTGKKACYLTRLTKRQNKKTIYFKFVAFNGTFNSFSDKYNSELFKGDVCEIFIKYGKENHYYEIEVAPNGTIFLADITNINDKFSGELIKECFIKASSKIFKNKYVVKILIPREKIKTKKVEYNAFRIDTNGELPEKHLFALHPTLCDTFHKSKFIY